MSFREFFLLRVTYFVAMIKFSWRGRANSKGVHILRGCIFKVCDGHLEAEVNSGAPGNHK